MKLQLTGIIETDLAILRKLHKTLIGGNGGLSSGEWILCPKDVKRRCKGASDEYIASLLRTLQDSSYKYSYWVCSEPTNINALIKFIKG